jgi:hypothetical protein
VTTLAVDNVPDWFGDGTYSGRLLTIPGHEVLAPAGTGTYP